MDVQQKYRWVKTLPEGESVVSMKFVEGFDMLLVATTRAVYAMSIHSGNAVLEPVTFQVEAP